jgi:RNA polymerase sigma-70 factor (ECF subfamily)
VTDLPGTPNADDVDLDLARRAQAGDLAALQQLLTRHIGTVDSLCRKLLIDPREAQEARLDVWFRAARTIHTFDGRTSFRTWLNRTTTKECRMRVSTWRD